MKDTDLHDSSFPCNTLNASITINPAITALVVAIAGIILPARALYYKERGVRKDRIYPNRDEILLTFNIKSTL